MPKPHHEAHAVWATEGHFTQLIYSPNGLIEGLLIDTNGTPTQYVIEPHDIASTQAVIGLQPGQSVVVEGSEAGPSPKGEGEHYVYRFERIAEVDGHLPESESTPGEARGKVTRFNYAKHGAANGVVLDSGDFVHTRPDGLAALGLRIGDEVHATGKARPLATGTGRVIEARTVNGQPVGPGH